MALENNIDQHLLKTKNILNSFPGFVIWKNSQLQFNMMNDTAMRLLNFKSHSDYQEKTEYEVPCVIEELANYYTAFDQETVASGKSFKSIQMLNIGGALSVYLTTGSPTKNADNQITGVGIYGLAMTNPGLINFISLTAQKDKKSFHSPQTGNRIYLLNESINNNYNFTSREMECLFFLIRGKTSKEIAKILKISPRTVETYLENIKLKMKCSNKLQVIANAITEDLINLMPLSLVEKFI